MTPNTRRSDRECDGEPASRPRLPPGIWALGFVSLLMDVSSEMIHALLPVYLVTVLGASTLSVGLIEGVAEATAAIRGLPAVVRANKPYPRQVTRLR